MTRRGKSSREERDIQSNVKARLEDDRDLCARAAQLAATGEFPSERDVLDLLKSQGLDCAVAARMEAEFDQRDRAKARSDLAEQRRAQVVELSRQGVAVDEIAARLGLSYGYVGQLRVMLGVARIRTKPISSGEQ